MRGEHDRGLQCAAGIEACAGSAGKLRPCREGRGPLERAVASDELHPVAGPRSLQTAQIGERNASLGAAPEVACQHATRDRIDLRRDEGRSAAARRAEHPLHIGRERQVARTTGKIANPQARYLDRFVAGNELQQVERDIGTCVFESAVSPPVPRQVVATCLADRQCRRPEQQAGIVVANIDGFSRPISDRIVRPGRESMLTTAASPGAAAAISRHVEAESGIGNHVDPRRGRAPPVAQHRHVFLAVGREATEAVEKLERRHVGRGIRRVAA